MRPVSKHRSFLVLLLTFGCAAAAAAGDLVLGPVTAVGELNIVGGESGVTFSPDGLTVLLSNDAADGGDIYASTRTSPDAPFPTPVLVSVLSSAQVDHSPFLARDNLEVFITRQPAGPGGEDVADIFHSTRACPVCPLSAPVAVGSINSMFGDAWPVLSPDGLTIYFSSNRPGSMHHDIWFATRPDHSSSFSAPRNLDVVSPGVNSSGADRPSGISPDGLDLLIHSDAHSLSAMDFDILLAQRRSLAAPFGPPTRLLRGSISDPLAVNTPLDEVGARFSADGRFLYVASARSGLSTIMSGEVIARSVAEPVLTCFDRPGDVAPARTLPDGTTVPEPDGRVNVADVVLLLRASVGLNHFAWQQAPAQAAPPPLPANIMTLEIGIASTKAFESVQVQVVPRASLVGYEFRAGEPGELLSSAQDFATTFTPREPVVGGGSSVNAVATAPAIGPGVLSRMTVAFNSAARPTCEDVDITITAVDAMGVSTVEPSTCTVQSYGLN